MLDEQRIQLLKAVSPVAVGVAAELAHSLAVRYGIDFAPRIE
jgi:hypothetical protein